jgi:hypothetical protein
MIAETIDGFRKNYKKIALENYIPNYLLKGFK